MTRIKRYEVLKCAMLACIMIMVAGIQFAMASEVPAYQERNMFETERITFDHIKVMQNVTDDLGDVNVEPLGEPIEFRIYNTTTQELESTVTSSDGELNGLNLIKEHNYMIQPVDRNYTIKSVSNVQKAQAKYVWVHDGKLVDIKASVVMGKDKDGNDVVTGYESNHYLTEIVLDKRKYPSEDPIDDSRLTFKLNVLYGEGPMSNVKFRFISDVETIEKTCQNGILTVSLLEEVPYTVIVDSDKYTSCVFPIAAKDKSEYDHGRFAYDHSSCKMVQTIQLVDKDKDHYCDTTIATKDGKVTATGFNFKDLILLDTSDSDAAKLYPKNAEIHKLRVVNTHRWEFSKLHCDTIGLTFRMDSSRKVSAVHRIDRDGNVENLEFEEGKGEIYVKAGRVSTDTYVIEYSEVKPVAKATKIKSLKGGKKSFTVKVAKVASANASGYQVRYSLKKNMSKAKTKTVGTKCTATSKTIKKLKSRKKYYVQVRTYLKVNGKTYYSKWSSKKAVKTK